MPYVCAAPMERKCFLHVLCVLCVLYVYMPKMVGLAADCIHKYIPNANLRNDGVHVPSLSRWPQEEGVPRSEATELQSQWAQHASVFLKRENSFVKCIGNHMLSPFQL